MKKLVIALPAILLLLGLSVGAYAMTGTPVNGEPAYTEVGFSSFTTSETLHDETVDNEKNWFKGWWWVTLTNNTDKPWATVTIKPGASNRVALVQGNGLEDEWGFSGNSIASNKAGNMVYSTPAGDGVRTYTLAGGGTTTGYLWKQAVYTFTAPVANNGGKVSFKIYTDNSYYTGPFDSSFCMCLTPNAAPVPEPSSMLALLGGIGTLGGLIRRRR